MLTFIGRFVLAVMWLLTIGVAGGLVYMWQAAGAPVGAGEVFACVLSHAVFLLLLVAAIGMTIQEIDMALKERGF